MRKCFNIRGCGYASALTDNRRNRDSSRQLQTQEAALRVPDDRQGHVGGGAAACNFQPRSQSFLEQ